jgi:hypothetical protein
MMEKSKETLIVEQAHAIGCNCISESNYGKSMAIAMRVQRKVERIFVDNH